jgi:predicted peptidase
MLVVLGMVSQSGADEPQPGKQVEQQLELDGGQKMDYLHYLPEEYVVGGDSGEENWPLMLFLHGRGESNGPLSLVAKWGPPQLVARGDSLPYILVSPQCPREESWSEEGQQAALVKLLDHVTQAYRVNTDRLYLTGLSMGGYGSWRLAADHPERFAAVVPVCGGGDPDDADVLKSLPIWVWHGDEDGAVPFTRSVEMVEAIRAAGGESIRFTTLEGVGHNSWSAAYATPELYDWLDRQSRE